MSVLIKGMEMPEKCGLCDLFHAESPMHCTVVKGHKTVGAPYGIPRPEWCPLVALPDTHGRLVDVDYFKEHLITCAENGRPLHRMYTELSELIEVIDNIPTIVEAEDSE